jgi:hypothetical protein
MQSVVGRGAKRPVWAAAEMQLVIGGAGEENREGDEKADAAGDRV